MAFDGIVTRSIVSELNNNIVGGRIDRVYQPEKDEIVIQIRSKGNNYKFLISASNNNPRFHLTDQNKKNPMEPPMFCMILRKYLIGSTILNIEQFLMDRIVFLDIASRDELGIDSEKRIVLEIMGRHSNIIIIDKETNKIIDSITRVSEDMSRVRQVFPGLKYNLPPLQDKDNPLDTNKERFLELIDAEKNSTQIFRFFYFNYHGLSPLISREFCYQADLDSRKKISELTNDEINILYKSFKESMARVQNNDFSPNIILNEQEDNILAFHALPIKQYEKVNGVIDKYDSISDLLDNYFYEKDLLDRIGQKAQSLRRTTKIHLDRAINKLKYQRLEYKESLDREKYKIYADLISANIHRIKTGSKEVKVQNFYDEDLEMITIPLDEKLSAPINAQRYYKKYSKLKSASSLLRRQIPRTKDEILYLENIMIGIENSSDVENLDETREELIKEGYIKGKVNDKKQRNIKSRPHHYISSDGMSIFVGKNNRQNDNLTFKTSHREDIWLHVQKMPGSHVVIRNAGKSVSEKTLEEAAVLAAFYSSARESNNVPVDYTERKNVRKPRGAKAGLAIYEDFNTIFVTPNRKTINNLKKEN